MKIIAQECSFFFNKIEGEKIDEKIFFGKLRMMKFMKKYCKGMQIKFIIAQEYIYIIISQRKKKKLIKFMKIMTEECEKYFQYQIKLIPVF